MPLGTRVLFYSKGVGRMKKILCLAMIAYLVSGCALTDRKNKLAVAAVTGGLAGAMIGWSVFGPGTPGIFGALTIGGVSAGAAYLVTDEMLWREKESLHRATYQSLQEGKEGQPTTWTSQDSSTRASITPMRTFHDKQGRLCRDFVVVFDIGKTRESVMRTACQGVDGAWQTV
jgi:surface antigen